MRKRSLIASLAAVLALCCALAGCGGAGPSSSAEEGKKNFAATWEVNGMTSDGEETSADDLELLKSLGMGVYLTLDEDGKATFEMFGIEMEGTWEASDATTAVLKFDDEDAEEAGMSGEQEMKLDDGTLTMESDDASMTFAQIDPADKQTGDLSALLQNVDASDVGSAVDGVESAVSSSATNAIASLSDPKNLDITVADDDTCTIKVTAVGDYYGDPGYVVSVTNKTDGQLVVDDNNEFDVNGKSASPIFAMELESGQTSEEILWFENKALDDGGVEALVNVKGKLVVTDGSGQEIATYDFAA